MTAKQTVTTWLQRARGGESASISDIVPTIHDQLYQLAQAQMSQERASHTLSATALVNEAYLRLVDVPVQSFENRAHFFGACARAMRQILIRHAERRNAQKRGGRHQRVPLDDIVRGYEEGTNLLALEEALVALGEEDSDVLEVVELRYFAGLNIAEIASLRNCSTATVERRWRWARSRLKLHLEGRQR